MQNRQVTREVLEMPEQVRIVTPVVRQCGLTRTGRTEKLTDCAFSWSAVQSKPCVLHVSRSVDRRPAGSIMQIDRGGILGVRPGEKLSGVTNGLFHRLVHSHDFGRYSETSMAGMVRTSLEKPRASMANRQSENCETRSGE